MPGLDADRRSPGAQRERNFGQRAQAATNGNDPIGRPGKDGVPGMTQPGGDGNIDVFVCLVRIFAWQQPDRQTTGGSGAAGRMLHYTGEPAANEHGVALRNATAQLEGQLRE
jgi:hypothetical protein